MLDLSSFAAIIFGILCLALVAAVVTRPKPLRGFLSNVTGLEIGLTGVKLQLAVDAAQRAIESKEGPSGQDPSLVATVKAIHHAKRVLWVDDDPQLCAPEVDALKAMGVDVDQALTNDEALRAVMGTEFDLIISDIGRRPPETPTEGIRLPGLISRYAKSIPPILYYVGDLESPETPQGFPATNRPSELFVLIESTLRIRR
jgi:hypothetical protein